MATCDATERLLGSNQASSEMGIGSFAFNMDGANLGLSGDESNQEEKTILNPRERNKAHWHRGRYKRK